jgi:hypothetical protein
MFSWLAQAELSSFARSAKLLPRSIYLSHQFLFHTLGEDYHALIRRYQLDISGHKIDIRKEVQVSAYSAGNGESFVEGFSSPRDVRNRTLLPSFDETLASARQMPKAVVTVGDTEGTWMRKQERKGDATRNIETEPKKRQVPWTIGKFFFCLIFFSATNEIFRYCLPTATATQTQHLHRHPQYLSQD